MAGLVHRPLVVYLGCDDLVAWHAYTGGVFNTQCAVVRPESAARSHRLSLLYNLCKAQLGGGG
jgi:hypothetical protein